MIGYDVLNYFDNNSEGWENKLIAEKAAQSHLRSLIIRGRQTSFLEVPGKQQLKPELQHFNHLQISQLNKTKRFSNSQSKAERIFFLQEKCEITSHLRLIKSLDINHETLFQNNVLNDLGLQRPAFILVGHVTPTYFFSRWFRNKNINLWEASLLICPAGKNIWPAD